MIQSVDRAVRILGVLQASRSVNLSEIAGRLGLAPSTVHGILKTLQAHGMVLQEHDSARYRLGPVVLKLGNVYLDTLELRSRAVTWSAELARRTGHAVRTGVPLPGEVMIVHHEPRPDGSRQMPEVGLVMPAHATALGKALLAYAPEASGGELRSMTGDTVTDPAVLREQLDAVRRDALATEREEAVLGECGLAAPVFDSSGLAVGAIGVVVPMPEWPASDDVGAAVREAARNVSRELGAPHWPAPGAPDAAAP
ncbi:IclR family transcriptional regulator [Nocardiopsis composta]|uniref:Glycerol operon regulatory protein n=1 Tax=Nocardiopsis composta TaxID=157465 RepID=A0A7W8QSZ0_9ACTN|nr:IclR family transcriptional regulator [Nocardiopsis composta]MBB5435584.1 DNA-binding IclR family transcriptional regulator [Nocardiopsis composta]